MSDGFYKIDQSSSDLLHAPNAVYGPGFTLTRDNQNETADGWAWFNSRQDAITALGWLPPVNETVMPE